MTKPITPKKPKPVPKPKPASTQRSGGHGPTVPPK